MPSGAGAHLPRAQQIRVRVACARLVQLLVDGLAVPAHAALAVAAEERDHPVPIRCRAPASVAGRTALRRGARAAGRRRGSHPGIAWRAPAGARVGGDDGRRRPWRRGRRGRSGPGARVRSRRGTPRMASPRGGEGQHSRIGRRAAGDEDESKSPKNIPTAQHSYPLSLRAPEQPARQHKFSQNTNERRPHAAA